MGRVVREFEGSAVEARGERSRKSRLGWRGRRVAQGQQ